MSNIYELLRMMADGRFHSGETLGGVLGVTRATVWNELQALQRLGVDVYAVPGKGYRLPAPVEMIDAPSVLEGMALDAREAIKRLEIYLELPSTNAYLMHEAHNGAPSGAACIAECQTAGRGRRGRTWVSPFGGNIYLSVLWRFASSASVVNGLSPALGVAVAEALHASGIPGVELKWPNDIVWQRKKLAGVLLEMAGESSGPCHVVAGVGVNVAMPADAAQAIDQPWIDAVSIRGASIARNHLAAMLLQHIARALIEFERDGFAAFLPRWRARDSFAGKMAELHLANETLRGIVSGIDDRGALLFTHDNRTRAYASGELSLREVAA